MRRSFLLLLPVIFSLVSCAPSRQAADQKLSKACVSGVLATFTDPKDHFEIKEATYAFQKSYDMLRLREVTIKGDYTYGESSPDSKTYTCTFTEEWSMFSYLPEFYNLQRDDLKFGNFNGQILGDTAQLFKISDAIHKGGLD